MLRSFAPASKPATFHAQYPALYGEGRQNSRKRRLRLVSVKTAKQLSLEWHGGSLENIKKSLVLPRGNFSADYEFSLSVASRRTTEAHGAKYESTDS
jgi:hypothetical protein